MYVPPAFAIDEDEAQAIMQAASLPVLVTQAHGGGIMATHLPLTLAQPRLLIGHIARANKQWQAYDATAEAMAIFAGVDGYISPSLYATKAETGRVVPTWNYEAVHAYGRLEILQSADDLLPIVTALTKRYEAGRPKPWAVQDAPADYLAAQLKGIVGIVLHVSRLEGARKLSQNKTPADQAGVIAGQEQENPTLAAAMKKV